MATRALPMTPLQRDDDARGIAVRMVQRIIPSGRSALFPSGLVRYGQRSGVDSMKETGAPVRLAVLAAAFAAGLSSAPLRAQAPAPPDFSKVEIQTSQLAPNFYRFEAVGPALVGNAGVLVGPDGIFM